MSSYNAKSSVRQAFGQSAACYDSVAGVQRLLASELIAGLAGANGGLALDAGCGTGFVSRLLAEHHHTRCLALDLAIEMCQQSGLTRTLCGDLESLPLAAASIDLYCSSLAWQWTDICKAANEAWRVLRPGGTLAVATLGPATLQELALAFEGIDAHRHVLPFQTAGAHHTALIQAGFDGIELRHRPLRVFARDLRTLLSELRTLGASELNAPRRTGLLGRQAWQKIEARYEAQREAEGLPLTYDALFLYARKPDDARKLLPDRH